MSVKHNSTCLLFKKNMYSDCNCIFLLFSPTDYEEGGGEGRNCSSRRLTLYHLHHRFFGGFFEWQLIFIIVFFFGFSSGSWSVKRPCLIWPECLCFFVSTLEDSNPSAASCSSLARIESHVGILRLEKRGESNSSSGLSSSRSTILRAVDEYLANIGREILYRVIRLGSQILLYGSQVHGTLYVLQVVGVLQMDKIRSTKTSAHKNYFPWSNNHL